MNPDAMTDHELEQLYRNCTNAIIENKPTKDQAITILAKINRVWEARMNAAIMGKYKAESPETGVLKTVGYCVGNLGLSTKSRWARLDYVMSNLLPFVGSLAHMREWGAPNSLARYQKLHRVLAGFRTSASNQSHMAKAFEDWTEDLDYIERTWKSKVR